MKTTEKLYEHTEDVHNTRAAELIVPILLQYLKPKSILDIGCGIGTWLKVFNDYGISDFIGVDGGYVDRAILKIERNKFLAYDLCAPLKLNRQFDLVVSLEVGEHLPESSADILVETLVKHGKVILFSAAIPGQGGQNHINEQWPIYWQKKFKAFGFEYYDLIRPAVWNNPKVEKWYKQNTFLLFHESMKVEYPPFKGENLIHPDFWNEVGILRGMLNNWDKGGVGVENSFKTFVLAVKKKLKKMF